MNPLDVMDRPAKRGFDAKLLVACCGGPFLDGYVMSIIGVALLGVAEDLNPTTAESGLIGAASLIGILFGATVFGSSPTASDARRCTPSIWSCWWWGVPCACSCRRRGS